MVIDKCEACGVKFKQSWFLHLIGVFETMRCDFCLKYIDQCGRIRPQYQFNDKIRKLMNNRIDEVRK